VKEVWEFYDKKHVGVIDKKQAEQFFKDALELFALRRGYAITQNNPLSI
jgi:hypothetical protein